MTFLKPLLFADKPNLRVVISNTAYKYNQKRLEVDTEMKTINIRFGAA
jgi:hypothetical protein